MWLRVVAVAEENEAVGVAPVVFERVLIYLLLLVRHTQLPLVLAVQEMVLLPQPHHLVVIRYLAIRLLILLLLVVAAAGPIVFRALQVTVRLVDLGVAVLVLALLMEQVAQETPQPHLRPKAITGQQVLVEHKLAVVVAVPMLAGLRKMVAMERHHLFQEPQ